MLEVVFLNERKVRVVKTFISYYACRLFVNKLKHSKRCTLISYPLFTY